MIKRLVKCEIDELIPNLITNFRLQRPIFFESHCRLFILKHIRSHNPKRLRIQYLRKGRLVCCFFLTGNGETISLSNLFQLNKLTVINSFRANSSFVKENIFHIKLPNWHESIPPGYKRNSHLLWPVLSSAFLSNSLFSH